jgi:dTDP-4-amino-4,6-dideoxygalactose transaminase
MGYYSRKYRFNENDFPNSFAWGSGTLSIPLFPGITPQEQEYVINVIVTKVIKMMGESRV